MQPTDENSEAWSRHQISNLFSVAPPTQSHNKVVFGIKHKILFLERQSSHVRLSESGAVLKFKQTQQAVWKEENSQKQWKNAREIREIERERDVKPNQFKLLTHCDCFF